MPRGKGSYARRVLPEGVTEGYCPVCGKGPQKLKNDKIRPHKNLLTGQSCRGIGAVALELPPEPRDREQEIGHTARLHPKVVTKASEVMASGGKARKLATSAPKANAVPLHLHRSQLRTWYGPNPSCRKSKSLSSPTRFRARNASLCSKRPTTGSSL